MSLYDHGGTQDPARAMEYERWISEHRPADPWGKCKQTTEAMATAFPELRWVRGHYVCPVDGRLPHWWLVTSSGEIVDPTRYQFASRGQGRYEPHEGPGPTGTCLNCGAPLYRTGWFCDAECEKETRSHLEGEAAIDSEPSPKPSSTESPLAGPRR